MKFEILDPEDCRESLAKADWNEIDMFSLERAIFLGTVFSMYPSGKYYTPFACSNVDPCEKCGGKGVVKNPNSDPKAHKHYQKGRRELSKEAVEKYGAWIEGNWPEDVEAKSKRLNQLLEETAETKTCLDCGGLGSAEAYLDQQYGEQLEAEADALDAYITAGEGDPCDIFLAQSMDIPNECEHCSSTHTRWLHDTTIECYDCGKLTEFDNQLESSDVGGT